MKITDGTVVSFHYTLRDNTGEIVDMSTPSQPLTYLHGAEQLLIALEKALNGHVEGDALCVRLLPEQAYGKATNTPPEQVNIASFPQHIELRPGIPFQAESSTGDVLTLWVTRIEGDKAWVTATHPLAGKALQYDIHIISIREPTKGERLVGKIVAPGFALSGYRAN